MDLHGCYVVNTAACHAEDRLELPLGTIRARREPYVVIAESQDPEYLASLLRYLGKNKTRAVVGGKEPRAICVTREVLGGWLQSVVADSFQSLLLKIKEQLVAQRECFVLEVMDIALAPERKYDPVT